MEKCPFCGEAEDISVREKRYHGGAVEVRGKKFWYVECLPCGIRTEYFFDGDYEGKGREAAIAAWNRRNA